MYRHWPIAHGKPWYTITVKLGGLEMIKELNQTCEKLNNLFRISVKLPTPNRNALNASSILNFITGAGLIAAGVIYAQKWCAVVGGISIVSSVVLKHEAQKK
jgi:hypothetical protein